MHDFFVAGAWRDYSSQSGAVQMRLSDYRALTGDSGANAVAIWTAKDVPAARIEAAHPRAAVRRVA